MFKLQDKQDSRCSHKLISAVLHVCENVPSGYVRTAKAQIRLRTAQSDQGPRCPIIEQFTAAEHSCIAKTFISLCGLAS